jgi:hypothetical protein
VLTPVGLFAAHRNRRHGLRGRRAGAGRAHGAARKPAAFTPRSIGRPMPGSEPGSTVCPTPTGSGVCRRYVQLWAESLASGDRRGEVIHAGPTR